MSSHDELNENNDYNPFYMQDLDIFFTHFYSIAELDNNEVFKIIFDAKTDKFSMSGMTGFNTKLEAKVKNQDIIDFGLKKDVRIKVKGIAFTIKSIMYDEFGISTLNLVRYGTELTDRYTEEL